MYAEASSTERPHVSPRPLAAERNHSLHRIMPADGDTALPTRHPAGTSYTSLPVVAFRDRAAYLFLLSDTSTRGDLNAIALPLQQPLEAALEDLRLVLTDAEEEGYPPPTPLALSNAERILRGMYALAPVRLEVYPTPDSEVAVVAPGRPRSSVMVLCDSDGSALCMVNMDGEHRRARYSTADRLPDGFLRDALAELAQRGG